MKTILLIIFTLCLGTNISATEFVLAPTTGYDSIWFVGMDYLHGACVGLHFSTILDNSLTIHWNNNFTINPRYSDRSRQGGMLWRTEVLCGKTFYFMDGKLRLGISGGADFTLEAEYIQAESSFWSSGLMFGGPCLYFNLDYYFIDNVGITFTLTECPNIIGPYFINDLSIKLGPSFKF